MRLFRVLKTGIRRARVIELGDDFVRVDIAGIRWSTRPGHHVYAYFPTLNLLRPWENHPFSVLPTAMLRSSSHSISASDSNISTVKEDQDMEKQEDTTIRTKTVHESTSIAGLTLFIRKSKGLTKSLKSQECLLTLLDGPYPNNPTTSTLQCDRLLLIGGGIGITTSHSNVKLYWSVKQSAQCLVQALEGALNGVSEKHVSIGRRLDVKTLLDEETQIGWAKIGIVVCGPPGLCDGVREAVSVAGREKKAIFELSVDAYSW